MNKLWLAGIVGLVLAGCGDKGAFIEEIPSQNDAPTAIAKLDKIITQRGLTRYGIIDHTAYAKDVNMTLKPNTLVMFSNPAVDTLLIQCNPSIGMDLPFKLLFSTSYEGHTTISYTNPEYWSLKHNIKDKNCLDIISKVTGDLRDLAQEISKK